MFFWRLKKNNLNLARDLITKLYYRRNSSFWGFQQHLTQKSLLIGIISLDKLNYIFIRFISKEETVDSKLGPDRLVGLKDPKGLDIPTIADNQYYDLWSHKSFRNIPKILKILNALCGHNFLTEKYFAWLIF